jgi:hypothetical protein
MSKKPKKQTKAYMRSHRKFGWVDRPKDVERVLNRCPHPLALHAMSEIRGSGAGQVALLYDAVQQVTGRWWPNEQTIGDCVSHGAAQAVRTLMCVEIAIKGENEKWITDVATEPIYAGSRVEIGGGQLGTRDGSIGAWGAQWIKEWGILLRQLYNPYDLTTYSGAKARQWGRPENGCPDILEPIAREHPVRTVSLVQSYEDARDLIANGYPITVASMVGFNDTRDSEGFLRASGTWAHQMFFSAVDDAHRRPGLLCENSWGPNWVTGPTRHSQPPGSFWVDVETVNRMFAQGDSWVVSNFEGYPAQKLDYMLI